ncbi:NTTRR-F1 domain [Vallitalea okinawensis]|uniref:NTTRR-F1 domain n=1 Tax=Vallitalea okinawensis TaxID=2078660 RepID=UPI000CFB6309|nr:NTTRR-F1 domain [Vallitalea okinawensis]
MFFQNLIKNNNFEDGTLDPWIGSNAYIDSILSPEGSGKYSAVLAGREVDASIHQIINVVPGESYNLVMTLATKDEEISPPITVTLEFLDLSGHPIKEGINYRLLKGQLSNYFSTTHKTIHETSLRVPANSYFAKLTIMKMAFPFTSSVVIDNVSLIRVKEESDIPTAYVGNSDTNIVSVVGSNLDAIVVGQGPVAMAKASVNGNQYIYVANEDGTVSVIQVSDNTVIATINLPGEPSFQYNRNILVNSNESTIYVANYDSSENTGYVSVIDTSTNTLTTSIMVQSNPTIMVLTNHGQPNSGLLYVINFGSHSISVIDTSNNTIADNFEIKDAAPNSLVITLDNQYFIVGYHDGHHFHIGEVSTNTIIKSVKYVSRKHLKSLTLSLDGTMVYAGYKVGGQKDEDGAAFKPYKVYDNFSHGSNTELGDYNKPSKPEMVAESDLSDDYTVIYVSVVDHGNYLYEIIRQTSTNAYSVMTRLDISSFTGFFALSSDNNYIVTVNSNGSVTYIDAATFSILETFVVANSPKVLLLLDSN